jgi:hypothetical protein
VSADDGGAAPAAAAPAAGSAAPGGQPAGGQAAGGQQPPGPGNEGEKKQPDGTDQGRAVDEGQRFREAAHDPRVEGGNPADAKSTARAYREGSANLGAKFTQEFEGNFFGAAHFGDRIQQAFHLQMRTTAGLLAARLPATELAARRSVYEPVPGFPDLLTALRQARLVVLCGEPGTGRLSTAIQLLDAVLSAPDTSDGADQGDPDRGETAGRDPGNTDDPLVLSTVELQESGPDISRLEPDTDLARLDKEEIEERHGYVVEPDAAKATELTELHLDRLSAVLAQRRAYAVVLISDEDAADRLTRGRYGLRCRPPAAGEVLRRHLGSLFGDRWELERDHVLGLFGKDSVTTALGLDELRPAEAFWLAELFHQHHTNPSFTEPELLVACGAFAARQAHAWFAGIDRVRQLGEALPALRTAAFRIALAVFNGSPYSLVVEAGEQLAWELAVTLDPENPPGRTLFTDDPVTRLAAARSVLRTENDSIGGSTVPVRTVRYQGNRLARSVLTHVWDRYHNVRGPMIRWFQGLSQDPRPQVWVRAAQAAGLLTARDMTYTFAELVLPMAISNQRRRRMFAAYALDQAAAEDQVTEAVRAIVRAWEDHRSSALRWTAAAVHQFGHVAGSVDGSLDAIARIGSIKVDKLDTDDADEAAENLDLWAIAGFSAVQLLATAEPVRVLDRIADWSDDKRLERQLLGLLAIARIAAARTSDLGTDEWETAGPAGQRVPDAADNWPLALTLAEVNEEWSERTADLLWTALSRGQSYQTVLTSIGTWIREAVRTEAVLAATVRFLPRLVVTEGDRDRLLGLLRSLVLDPDDPLPKPVAKRIAAALQSVAVQTERYPSAERTGTW